ncbi:pantoate--beta-alanine ligase [Paenisporosarcina quisquiliarum]|uniref:Pantothenate synthetase n=1 Tax=Paenisporosarcina quisquiliarum TaxID=365346 RepID=A0A9X3RCY5_9BACL|nr:pantoate--beta-alanine ligase [Paenisporosarcina quisquiliarum]MCZ8535802.1 pantoate--beta-alanine ligase [Paenisporosarcina quisquiliarum]
MIQVQLIKDLKQNINATKKSGKSIGFVPTMGYLHEGHMSLVEQARKENDFVVMSIFVNPAQFGPNEDLDRYPRDLERDTKMAVEAGVDLLFFPQVNEMYPQDGGISIRAGAQADVLCGASRPGHFDGVLKVVTKLFHLVEPTKVYFGQKDAQQLAIIETLVRDYNFPLEVKRVSTVREEDGLAKSSRNVFLSEKERAEAPIIQQAIQLGMDDFKINQDSEKAKQVTIRHIENGTSGKIDYVELLSYPDLTNNVSNNTSVILAVAVFFEKARLIDNLILNNEENK